MKERTILLNGFSKAYAMTGWRVGYAAAPQEIIHGMTKIHQYTLLCAPTMGQMAAIEALKEGNREVESMVREYDRRRRIMVKGLRDIGLSCFEPKGAFYVFPNITGTGKKSKELEEFLLEEAGVAGLSGTSFGEYGEGYLRFSYANSQENLRKALDMIRKVL